MMSKQLNTWLKSKTLPWFKDDTTSDFLRAKNDLILTYKEKVLTTPGKILVSRSTAAMALDFPPPRQSSNSYSGCRTGLEYEIFALSTNVMRLTPHPWRTKEKHISCFQNHEILKHLTSLY